MATRQAPPAERASAPAPTDSVLRVPNVRRVGGDDWAQLVRYCVVGGSGYLVNLGVFSIMIGLIGAHYAPAAVTAFVVAWSSNFVFNKYWTFRRHERSAVAQGWRNLLVSLGALAGNVLLLEIFVRAGAPAVLAQAAAIALVMPPNFLLNRRWSFR